MLIHYKNNAVGYFKFIFSIVGVRIILSSFLSILVSILDGIGLSMFIPLLQSMDGKSNSSKEAMGYLHFITDAIKEMGFSLSIYTLLLILVILFVLKGFVRFLEFNYQASLIQFFMKKVRLQLLTGLENINYKGFLNLDAGRIQNTFTGEVHRTSEGMRHFLGYSQSIFMLSTYVILAVLANYQFAILITLGAGLSNILFSRFYKKMKNISAEISKKGDSFNSYMIQAVKHFKYLKATNYLTKYSRKLDEVIINTEILNKKTGFYNAITNGMREPMILLIVVVVIFIQLYFMGGNLGSVILSLLLFYRALNFLVVSQQQWQNFLQNSGAFKSVAIFSEKLEKMAEVQGSIYFETLNQDIVIKNVDFSFGDKKVLDNASLIIPVKKTIALVGESGSGKTTLANIIMGLLIPDKGNIKIGHRTLSDYNLNSYRNKIGYISQDPVIFNDNLYNNVTFWAEPTEDNLKKFWRVIELALLSDFVKDQTNRELTPLGDNGILISGGQKQRISIAREMFKDSEILVLDEATSALDSETERLIQENIEKLHGQYTMVVIAHRLSTIKNVDKIYLLENGRVVISGDFKDMLNNSDKFKRMVFLQGL